MSEWNDLDLRQLAQVMSDSLPEDNYSRLKNLQHDRRFAAQPSEAAPALHIHDVTMHCYKCGKITEPCEHLRKFVTNEQPSEAATGSTECDCEDCKAKRDTRPDYPEECFYKGCHTARLPSRSFCQKHSPTQPLTPNAGEVKAHQEAIDLLDKIQMRHDTEGLWLIAENLLPKIATWDGKRWLAASAPAGKEGADAQQSLRTGLLNDVALWRKNADEIWTDVEGREPRDAEIRALSYNRGVQKTLRACAMAVEGWLAGAAKEAGGEHDEDCLTFEGGPCNCAKPAAPSTRETELRDLVHKRLGAYLNTMVAELNIEGKGQYLRDLFGKFEAEFDAILAADKPQPPAPDARNLALELKEPADMLAWLNELNSNWFVCRNTRAFKEGQPAEYWKKFDAAMRDAFELQVALMKLMNPPSALASPASKSEDK